MPADPEIDGHKYRRIRSRRITRVARRVILLIRSLHGEATHPWKLRYYSF